MIRLTRNKITQIIIYKCSGLHNFLFLNYRSGSIGTLKFELIINSVKFKGTHVKFRN